MLLRTDGLFDTIRAIAEDILGSDVGRPRASVIAVGTISSRGVREARVVYDFTFDPPAPGRLQAIQRMGIKLATRDQWRRHRDQASWYSCGCAVTGNDRRLVAREAPTILWPAKASRNVASSRWTPPTSSSPTGLRHRLCPYLMSVVPGFDRRAARCAGLPTAAASLHESFRSPTRSRWIERVISPYVHSAQVDLDLPLSSRSE